MAKKTAKANQKTEKTAISFFQRYRWELVIFVFSVLLYANAVPNGYSMDDELVTINHRLTSKGVAAIPEIFTTSYYKDEVGYAYEYRPMVLASFAIEHQFFGDNAIVSHLFNVLLYGLCCVLLYRVLLRVISGLSMLIPVGITLLFIAHPAHTEVVDSIKNRDEILGLIFSLLTWWAAFKAVNENNKWLLLVPLFFIAALMSKMSVLPFNIIIPLAIILFTNAGFKKIASVTLLLALSSFIVLNSQLYDKLIIAIGILVATCLLFVIIRFSTVTEKARAFLKATLTRPSAGLHTASENTFKEGVKDFFAGVSVDYRSYLSFQPMAITFTAAIVFIAGIVTGFQLLVGIAGAAFIVLLIWGNEKTIWWATILLYICLIVALSIFPLNGSIFADFITLSVIYQIFYGDRKLLIPSIIFYALLLCLELKPTSMSVGVLALIAFRWKWTRPAVLIFLAGGIYSSYNEFSKIGFLNTRSFFSDNYSVLLAPILIISIWLRSGTKIVLAAFPALAIVALLTLKVFSVSLSPVVAKQEIKTQINTLGTKVNTNIVTGKVDRPISFVEQPVTASSPEQLRLGTSFEILFIYLHKVVMPYPMSFYYGYKFIEPENITSIVPLISLLLYAGLFGLALFYIKRNKLLAFGILVYLISIAAVASYFFPIPGQLGERFLFIPSLGWSMVFVAVLVTLFKAGTAVSEILLAGLPKGFKYSFAGLLLLYCGLTFSRNFDWKDYYTVAKHDINYVQNSSQANNLVALNLMRKSYEEPDVMVQKEMRLEALQHLKKALEIYPSFYNVTYDIARVYNVLNQNDSSIIWFKAALAIDSTNPNPALFIGQMLIAQNKFSEAIPYLQFVIDHHTADYQAFDRLSFAYFRLNDYNASIAVNQSAIKLLPPQAAPYINIAHVYVSLNQTDSARIYLQKAAQFNPNDPNVQQMMQQIAGH